jgi:hypothetical protein
MTAMSQSVAISDDSVADGSAYFRGKITTKGFLTPRMTAEQRDAIVDQLQGLQIWCSDCFRYLDKKKSVYSGVSGQI